MTRSSRRRPATPAVESAQAPVFAGGRYQPLTESECEQIIDSSLDILQGIGIADTPDWLQRLLLENGAGLRQDGRVTFARGAVEKALRRASHRVSLPGFDDNRGLDIGGGHVHIGSGGAAVQTLDSDSGEYRDSTLRDLYRMMRVLERCEHVHYGIRPLIARDMPTAMDLDINTAYACLLATAKPIGVSFDNAAHVAEVTRMLDIALEPEQQFRKHPFCFGVIVHVVPPLRFSPEGVDIMRAAIEQGMPLQICSAGQAGATSPASLAGALAQGLAESLAGMMVVDAIKPGHPCIYAFMPFISDLRTGAMSGGGGESAVANAAAAQLLRKLELPATVSAGMTDSKIEDAQAGYEKGYSIALAANAGADMINLSVGMLGSIMVASPEALVIDDDMCGAILRTVRGIEIGDDALDLDAIERVVGGDGHYLGEAQTLRLMKTEYVYPDIGDRQSLPDWIDSGRLTIWERARQSVSNILQDHRPAHLSIKADRRIRDNFNIRLTISEDNK
jgi:trimethylamine--corrinoid protein Co-methyltransferase